MKDEKMTPHNLNNRLARRDFLRMLLVTGGSLALSPLLKACSGETGTTQVTVAPPGLLDGLENLGIDTFFEESYRRWLMRDPEMLTTLGLADSYGAGDANLTDISDAFILETQSLESGMLDLLRSYDRASFTPSQSLTADVYEWFLDDLVLGHPFMYDNYPINPTITSVPYNLYLLFTVWHPLNKFQDAEDYISRLSQVGTKISQLIDGLRRRQERSVVLPAFMIPIVRDDVNAIAYGSPPSHPFYEPFVERLTGVSADKRQGLIEQVKTQIKEVVNPSYKELSTFLTSLQTSAPTRIGVWQFPDGEACYAQSLHHQTITELTADEIYELGLQNVERIHAEMRPLFAELGYPGDESIPDLINRLTNDSGVYQGQAAVQAYEDAIRGAELLLPQVFDILPKAQVTVVGGPEGDYYDPPPFDGSRPGIFYASTNGYTPKFGVKTLAYHETIPGHHLQAAIILEQTGLPALRRGMQFNAFCEGWALYAERLMWELGAYTDDPQGNLGRLQAEVYRAARLVVDTGIHVKQWGFDQAVDYLAKATGFPVNYAQAEITRYSVWPGQAVSYYVGFLKFQELRRKSMDALGDRFSLKAFHRAVLVNGSLPLSVLEDVVSSYITSNA
jgi:uncharacterized protein (DUF885 family)